MNLGGMIWWHDALGLEVQSTSPLMHMSMCQTGWSSKAPDQKRSILLLLVCIGAAKVTLHRADNGWGLWQGSTSTRESKVGWEPDGEIHQGVMP